jgi:hypothetical protein
MRPMCLQRLQHNQNFLIRFNILYKKSFYVTLLDAKSVFSRPYHKITHVFIMGQRLVFIFPNNDSVLTYA